MWIADGWKDYEVLDTSDGEKLERWGKYILVRPDPQVIWDTPKNNPGWKKKWTLSPQQKGGGEWEFFHLPKQWTIQYKDLTFNLKPFSFKHTGLFPEQSTNWDWFSDKIKNAGRPVKVLNLFAYTGGATFAAAAAGASVTHVDASKGMVSWAKENAVSSGLGEAPIRWIVDDCVKFVEREIRRGNHYDAIIMDPLLRSWSKGRDLEDRGGNSPADQAVRTPFKRQTVVFPGEFLYYGTGPCRAYLYDRYGIETIRRHR